jgi:hypothetical protein
MDLNSDIDILGCNVQLIGADRKDQKVMCFPLNDELIKYNMNYYCPLAHPTIMVRLSTMKNKLLYQGRKIEDYRLWL